MPTYEYRCASCGQHIEVVQSFSDDPLTVCGACGGPLRKVFSPVGIVFKGSGFYKTDNRAGRSTPKEDTKKDTKKGTKTDAKPDTKSGGGSSSGSEAASTAKDSKIA